MMEVSIAPAKRTKAPVSDTDAFCGPCFHNAINHGSAPGGGRMEPLCWECPGSKADYDGQPYGWWDRPGEGDPSLEGWTCQRCPRVVA